MATKARCPNDGNHNRFITTAHVMQEWLVDASGNFLEEVSNLEVVHSPHSDNEWTCSQCGAVALVAVSE